MPLSLSELSDLPPELLAELSISASGGLERQMLAVIEACGGTANLDQILIGLYRKFGVIQKRRFIQQKLWRVQKAGGV